MNFTILFVQLEAVKQKRLEEERKKTEAEARRKRERLDPVLKTSCKNIDIFVEGKDKHYKCSLLAEFLKFLRQIESFNNFGSMYSTMFSPKLEKTEMHFDVFNREQKERERLQKLEQERERKQKEEEERRKKEEIKRKKAEQERIEKDKAEKAAKIKVCNLPFCERPSVEQSRAVGESVGVY